MMTRGRWHPVACLYPSMPNHALQGRHHLLLSIHATTSRPPAVKPRTPRGRRKDVARRGGSIGEADPMAMGARAEPSGRFRRTQIPARPCENPRGRRKGDGDKGIPRNRRAGGVRRPSQPHGPAATKPNQTHPHGGGMCRLQRARSGSHCTAVAPPQHNHTSHDHERVPGLASLPRRPRRASRISQTLPI